MRRALAPALLAVALTACGATAVGPPAASSSPVRSSEPSISPSISPSRTPEPTFAATVSELTPTQRRALVDSGTWRAACPVSIEELRVMTVTYWGFDRRLHVGTLMMNEDAAAPLRTVMRALFEARFSIRRMVLVDEYGGSDERSMRADNSYAFGCGEVPGRPGMWSQHAYGRALDLNPIENPEIRGGVVSPAEGAAFADRSRTAVGMIHQGDRIVRAFSSVRWVWGGTWRTLKDYMHFSANGY